MTTHPSPGIYSILTDNSRFNPDELGAGSFGLFHAFSRRGVDNKIQLLPSLNMSHVMFGKPDYSRFGIHLHAANQWLAGGTPAYICRLLPSDAVFANATFGVTEKEYLLNTVVAPFTGLYNGTATTGNYVYESTTGKFYVAAATVPVEVTFNEAGTTWTEIPVFAEGLFAIGDAVTDSTSEKLYICNTTISASAPFDPTEWDLIGDRTVATVPYTKIIQAPYIGDYGKYAVTGEVCSYEGEFWEANEDVNPEVAFNDAGTTWSLVPEMDLTTITTINSIYTDTTHKKLYKAIRTIAADLPFNAADWLQIGDIETTTNYKSLLLDPYVGLYGGTALVGKVVFHKDFFYKANKNVAAEDSFNQDGVTWSKVARFKASETYDVDDLSTDAASEILYKCITPVGTPASFDSSKWEEVGRKVTGAEVLDVKQDKVTDFQFNTEDIIGDKVIPATNKKPFLSFYAEGRGADYNKLSIVVSENIAFKDTFDFKVYNLSIYDKDDNGFDILIEGNIPFTLKPDAVDLAGDSLFLDDILDEYDNIPVKSITDFSETLVDDLITYLSGKTGIAITYETLFNFDILGDLVDETVNLLKGSDGSLLDSKFNRVDPTVVSSLINEFYSGAIDVTILNPKEVEASFVFDIGLPLNNKFDVNEFTQYTRNDIFAYLSDSYARNEESFLDFRLDDLTADNKYASIRGGFCTTYDDYSGRYIKVPTLYNIIKSISYNNTNLGCHIPKAGYDARGLVPNVKAHSLGFSPTKLYEDKFYLHQINHPVTDTSGIFYLSTRTMQKYNSSLSNESVVQTVQRIQRETEKMGKLYLIKLITPTLLADIENDYKRYFQQWLQNGALESANVYVVANRIDRKNNRVRVYMEVVFSGILEKLLLNTIVK